MRIFRVLFLSVLIAAIAGCGGSTTLMQPTVNPQATEFLYVGTSQPGLMKFAVASNGALTSVNVDTAIPAVCAPALSPVPGGRIFSLSEFCPFSLSRTELREFQLAPDGNITASSPPISLGPDLPSDTGFIFKFVAAPEGSFGYAWSIALNGSQHISPVQVGSNGTLTIEPELGVVLPLNSAVPAGCNEDFAPDAVIQNSNGLFLSIADSVTCEGTNFLTATYPIYTVDSQSGTVGSQIGSIPIQFQPQSFFAAYNGALAMTGEVHLPGAGAGKTNLQLLQIAATGVTQLQQCFSDQPACAHPDAGAFHPSGKWVFIADSSAGGIWMLPVSGNSMAPERASFISATVSGGVRFGFSADGTHLYVAHWDSLKNFGEILGFNVDQQAGSLSPIMGSPWPIGSITSVTSLIDITGKTQ